MTMPLRFPLRALVWCATGSLCLLLAARAVEPADTKPACPPWDGRESIAQYAMRANLPPTKTLDLGNGVTMELVLIPAGTFIMGMPERESPWIGGAISGSGGLIVLVLVARLLWRAAGLQRRPQFSLRWLIAVVLIVGVAQYGGFRCWRAVEARRNILSDASPAHAVTLTKAFYISKLTVTQAQYRQVVGTNPSPFLDAGDTVEGVSWDDAQEFCKKASTVARSSGSRDDRAEFEGRPAFRLPTEAEWEYACRAGGTPSVDGVTPNGWGVHDMPSSMWEWCEDWSEPYRPEPVVDPQGPAQGELRVLRGRSWDRAVVAHRIALMPRERDDRLSFRVVVMIQEAP